MNREQTITAQRAKSTGYVRRLRKHHTPTDG